MSSFDPIEVTSITPLHDGVIVSDMAFNERMSTGGIFIPSDDKLIQGVHPRWAKVYAIGPQQTDVKVGEWICIAHGRWTRGVEIKDETGIHTIRRVDNNDILFASEEKPVDDILGRPL